MKLKHLLEPVNEWPATEKLVQFPPAGRVEQAGDPTDDLHHRQPDCGLDGANWPADPNARRQPVNQQECADENEPTSHQPISATPTASDVEPPMCLLPQNQEHDQRNRWPRMPFEPPQPRDRT